MNNNRPQLSRRRLIGGVAVAIFLLWCLEPTAWLFYELHHLTGIGPIYYGYSVFRAGGYFLGQSALHVPISLLLGLLVALPWWQGLKSLLGRSS